MEPLEDDDLKHLLRRWEAPGTPDRLRQRIFGAPARSKWTWLLTGSVRVPLPACAALIVLMAWLAIGRGASVTPEPPAHSTNEGVVVSLADFQPPAEMRVRLVGEVK